MRRVARNPWVGIAIVLNTLGWMACANEPTGPATAASVTVTPNAVTIAQGDAVQFSAVVRDAGGQVVPGAPVAWSSADAGVATVESGGMVLGVGAGSASITAESGGVTGTGSVMVTKGMPGLVVSDAVPIAGGDAGTADSVTYVSLAPGTIPGGRRAAMHRVGDSTTVTTAVLDGGFDPTPVGARTGDSIDIVVTGADGGILLAMRAAVIPARPPVVVRTNPPRKKTDVPINASVVIVFSEPIDAGSLTPQGVQLLRNTTLVAGTVRRLQGSATAAVFEPSTPLDANSTYELHVTRAVTDLDGDRLAAEITPDFQTGSTALGDARFAGVEPDTSAVAVGSQLLLTATAADSTGRPISGRPVVWSSDSPSVASVSSTGLVTALAQGEARIRASIDNAVGIGVVLVSATLGPVASVEVSPPNPTIPVNGGVRLSAILRDAAGNVLPFRPVTWASSDPGVVTVSGATGATTVATGVAAGTATVTATSEGKSGTASLVVVVPGRYGQLSTANGHTCAVTFDGWASCWGWNAYGQLGNGTVDDAPVPVPVSGGITFAEVSVGYGFSCALTPQGTAYCWGTNPAGELGVGSDAGPDACPPAPAPGLPCSQTPVAVAGGLEFAVIRAAGSHACALTTGGVPYCWGHNSYGQLGVGTSTGPEDCGGIPCSMRPVPVTGGLTFTDLALGEVHTCGLTASGTAYCWGANDYGQLGDSATTGPEDCGGVRCSMRPVAVAGGLTFVTLGAGDYYTCGVTSDGSGFCWGMNEEGRLGVGTYTGPEICEQPGGQRPACSRVPAAVVGGLSWQRIGAGWYTCGVTRSGAAYCWGANRYGQLGIGDTALESCQLPWGSVPCSPTPLPVTGGLTFATLATGGGHSCGVTTAGIAYCWGENIAGQLGIGVADQDPHAAPARVAGQP